MSENSKIMEIRSWDNSDIRQETSINLKNSEEYAYQNKP